MLSDLLADLMHYSDQNSLDFDKALDTARRTFTAEQTAAGKYTLDSLVQLTGSAAEEAEQVDLATRGVVTGLDVSDDGPTAYYVRCPGERGAYRFTGDELEPASPFPPTRTHQGLVENPSAAEEALVDAFGRINAARHAHAPAQPDDIQDCRHLLTALSAWSGLPQERLAELIQAKSSAPAADLGKPVNPKSVAAENAPPRFPGPAELAAQSFPLSPNDAARHTDTGQPASRLAPPATNKTPDHRRH